MTRGTGTDDISDHRPAPSLRRAVRALIIDPLDRVLMVELEWPSGWRGWILPGGGIRATETDEAALRRELAEETGLRQAFIGPPVLRRRHVRRGMIAGYDGQEEVVYLVPTRGFDIAPEMTESELRAEYVVGHRWWTVAEMESTSESLRPEGLAELTKQTLEFGAPTDIPQIDIDDDADDDGAGAGAGATTER